MVCPPVLPRSVHSGRGSASATDRIDHFTDWNNARGNPIYPVIGTEFGSEWPSEMVKLVKLDAAT